MTVSCKCIIQQDSSFYPKEGSFNFHPKFLVLMFSRDSIFTESHGSHKDAAKVMIVLTDGEILLDEMDLTAVINSPKMAGIKRYAIGVGWECTWSIFAFYFLVAPGADKRRNQQISLCVCLSTRLCPEV